MCSASRAMVSDYDSSSKKENLAVSLTKHRRMWRLSHFEGTLRTFSPGERLLLHAFVVLFAISTFALVAGANAAISTTVPSHGGTLVEGVVGPVRFINPLLSLSGPDKDLATLVYSGLTRVMPDGSIIPDLAKAYEISEDGLVYTFTLRDKLTFHDGAFLTSADVLFTVERAKNADIKSTRRADWEGVIATAPDSRTITFTLPHAYAPFLENTALGILPKHLWENVSADEFPFHPLNIHPIGSGPYRVDSLDTNSTGSATRYELSSFKKFALGEAHLKGITFLFYANEEALLEAFTAGRIDAIAGVSPSFMQNIARKDVDVARAALPRTFGVFFNHNKNAVLADATVRSALDAAIDKKKIVDEVFKGFGVVLEGPIPPGILGRITPATPAPLSPETEQSAEKSDNIEAARAILSKGGWTFDENTRAWKKKNTVLGFTLATADEPELAATAELLASEWNKAGINVDVHVYPLSELNSLVLRPRNYEAVLFGEVVGRSLDLFAFWHSSQRNDPGLNIALYTNSKVDTILARARATTKRGAQEKLYAEFEGLIAEDKPAVFLYAPEFIYIVPEKLQGVELGALTVPAERFLNAHEWYTDTERVWNIFSKTTE